MSLLADLSAADDIVQETGATAWVKFDQFKAGTNFNAWVFRIARLKVYEFYRSTLNEDVNSDLLDQITSQSLNLSHELDEQHEHLAECLKKLETSDRLLIQLRYGSDKSASDIAEEFNCTKWAIYKMLGPVHDMLFRCIAQRIRLVSATQEDQA